jgi:hypothetical protein
MKALKNESRTPKTSPVTQNATAGGEPDPSRRGDGKALSGPVLPGGGGQRDGEARTYRSSLLALPLTQHSEARWSRRAVAQARRGRRLK